MYLKFSLLILLIIFALPAHAHRPYLVKEGYLKDPNGNPLIKEKRYGDGIFVSDPETFQIRNLDGAVLANSPVDSHVASFCPSINLCWVFPYGILSPFSFGRYLNVEQTDFGQKEEKNFTYDDTEKYALYLKDKNTKKVASSNFGYPEYNRSHSGFKFSLFITFLSPIFIIIDQYKILLILFLECFAAYLIYWLFFRWKKIQRTLIRIMVFSAGTVTIISYFAFIGLTLLFTGFTLSAPWIYMLIFMILGFYCGKKLMGKILKRQIL